MSSREEHIDRWIAARNKRKANRTKCTIGEAINLVEQAIPHFGEEKPDVYSMYKSGVRVYGLSKQFLKDEDKDHL